MPFYPGQTLGRGDLNIFLVDQDNNPMNPAEITYGIYYEDPDNPGVVIPVGNTTMVPVNPTIGEFYASLMIPPSATPGNYRILWTFKKLVTSVPKQTVYEFVVQDQGSIAPISYGGGTAYMLRILRMQLRDQNPDKFYHFRPPEFEGNIGRYDRVFGQIWEDAELVEYLRMAMDWWNMFPPFTGGQLTDLDRLVNQFPAWKTAVMWAAVSHACFALSCNWVADEFDYSIGGVSLSLERSSKYQGLKSDADSQFDKAADAKVRTTKYTLGLQQPRFGIGVRSSFGPYVGRGVMSPRNFM